MRQDPSAAIAKGNLHVWVTWRVWRLDARVRKSWIQGILLLSPAACSSKDGHWTLWAFRVLSTHSPRREGGPSLSKVHFLTSGWTLIAPLPWINHCRPKTFSVSWLGRPGPMDNKVTSAAHSNHLKWERQFPREKQKGNVSKEDSYMRSQNTKKFSSNKERTSYRRERSLPLQ